MTQVKSCEVDPSVAPSVICLESLCLFSAERLNFGQTPQSPLAAMFLVRCSWTRCGHCGLKSRLPSLCQDPLFHGPSSPCLLKPAVGEKALEGRGTFLCPNEGLPVASWLARHSIQTLVLRYRLLPHYDHHDALADLEAAVELVRRHKDGPVAAIGFSAGGILVASLSLRLGKRDRTPLDAQVLVYPAIDGSDWAKEHSAGFWDPACNKNTEKLLEGSSCSSFLSMGLNCASRSSTNDSPYRQHLTIRSGRGFAAPPSFIVGSTGDAVCPAKVHTDPYVAALRKRRIPHEYIRGNLGEHGFGLDRCWSNACSQWLQQRGFGKKTSHRSWAGCRLLLPITAGQLL
eukprot:g16786.t1